MANGEFSENIVYENADVIAAINPFSLAVGHTLVMPRRHIQNIYELPDAAAGPILSAAAIVARAAKQILTADGVTLRQNNEAASDQHLFHFHLHVIPRFAGDSERFNSEAQLFSTGEQKVAAAIMREGLSK